MAQVGGLKCHAALLTIALHFPCKRLTGDLLTCVGLEIPGLRTAGGVLRKYHVDERDIKLDQTVVLESGPINMATASNMPVPQLFKEHAKVYVQADPDREPAYVQVLRQEIRTVRGEVHNLQTRVKDLETAQQRQRDLARRELLAISREKLAGHKLSSQEKTTWNSQLSNIPAPAGVSPAAIRLTRYGPGTDQEDGNTAAHVFADAIIADAVVSLPVKQAALYRQLFNLCFSKTADDVILSLEPPAEDEGSP